MADNLGRLMNEQEAAAFLAMSVKTLQQWRFYCKPPVYHKFGRSVRYSLSDLEDFVASRKVSPVN